MGMPDIYVGAVFKEVKRYYHITSNRRPGRLLNFRPSREGGGGSLFEGEFKRGGGGDLLNNYCFTYTGGHEFPGNKIDACSNHWKEA